MAFGLWKSLAECAVDLIRQWLHQIGHHGPLSGLDERFDWHSGHELHTAETGDLFRGHRNPDRVVALVCALIRCNVGGDLGNVTEDFRCRAEIESRKAQRCTLADLNLVDILGVDLGLNG